MCRIVCLTLLRGGPHRAPGYYWFHTTRYYSAARIQGSWSSKSLVKEGVTCYLCCMSYYCRSTTSSTPYYLLKPWTWVNKTIYWAVFSSWGRTAIFLWWEASSICAGAFPVYHIWPFLTMDQLPHVFVPSRTPLVLEFPCGLELEPVISKNRLSMSGRLLPVVSPRSL